MKLRKKSQRAKKKFNLKQYYCDKFKDMLSDMVAAWFVEGLDAFIEAQDEEFKINPG